MIGESATLARGPGSYARGMAVQRYNKAVTNVKKEIASAEKELKVALEELETASHEFESAQSDFKIAKAEIERAKKTLADRLGPRVGLPDALADLAWAKEAYEQATTKAISRLRTTTKYEDLKQKLDAAESEVAELRQKRGSKE